MPPDNGTDLTLWVDDSTLAAILLLLPQPTDVFRCARVCRRWHGTPPALHLLPLQLTRPKLGLKLGLTVT